MDLMSTTQLLGNIGEFAGAIAVVVTLVYLARQVRGNSEATMAIVRQSMSEANMSFLSLGLDSDRLIDTAHKAQLGETLTDKEAEMLILHQHVNFRLFEGYHSNYKRGFISESEWKAYEDVIATCFRANPWARKMWEEVALWPPEFADVVDRIYNQTTLGDRIRISVGE
jgi:hypothetical protein